MTIPTTKIVEDARSFITDLFAQKLSNKFVYHNQEHTENVVKVIEELIEKHQLTDEEEQIVLLAGWLHCTGYSISATRSKQHSIQIAKKYLYAYGYEMDFIEQVQNTILALQYPRKPHNILEKILCDATLKDLSTTNFMMRSNALRKEWELNCFAIYDTLSWYENTLKFLDKHVYFTEYAQQNWSIAENQQFLREYITTFK